MPKQSKTLHNEFRERTVKLNDIRISFENAFNANNIGPNDIVQAYAGLYLDLFTVFENLIEELFIGLLTGNITHVNTAVVRKLKITPQQEIQNVLLSGKSYLDWLPYTDHTIKRAKIYFDNGNPFNFLTQPQKDELSNFHKIRNAIAHKSKKAINEFDAIIQNLTLTVIEKTPQGYLRNKPQGSNAETQLEIITTRLLLISHALCY